MRQRVKIVIKEEIVRELYAIAGEDAVQTAEPMKNHTTFRVGGPADYFVAPHTEEEIRKIVALCEEKEIPWFVTLSLLSNPQTKPVLTGLQNLQCLQQ